MHQHPVSGLSSLNTSLCRVSLDSPPVSTVSAPIILVQGPWSNNPSHSASIFYFFAEEINQLLVINESLTWGDSYLRFRGRNLFILSSWTTNDFQL